MNPSSKNHIIRITREEALDEHVDDMLKRQMSLRGQPGVSREHGRRWFYQNWFIFMLVGGLGAVLAWALLEPSFDDLLYVQGTISDLDHTDSPFRGQGEDELLSELDMPVRGSFSLKGQKIHLMVGARELVEDGAAQRIEAASLEDGDTIGVYVDYYSVPEFDLALASFVVRDPPPQSARREKLTLDQLSARSSVAGLLLFAVVAGLVGLFIGSADGLVCRLPRRAVVCGLVGLLVGLVGGFVSGLIASLAYVPLNTLATRMSENSGAFVSTFGFIVQLIGRSLAWAVAGLAMGLGQGIALRSKKLLFYGLIGGVIGGLFGGLLFDPIDLILGGTDVPSAHWSRLIGFAVIGLGVGAMIGVVELLARDAWMRMTQGPLTGKEFLLFKDTMSIGSSPRSDIYLFNDPLVAEHHALLRAVGDECEIETRSSTHPVLHNNRSVSRARLRHGDTVTIGRTAFVFQQRKT